MIKHGESGRDAAPQKDKHPALSSLFATTVLDNKMLGGLQRYNDLDNAKFNGCIFEHGGRRMICYRAYSEKLGGKSNIFITMLNGLTPAASIELDLPRYSSTIRQYEDARLFEHKGELYLSYVAVEYVGEDGKETKYWAAIHVVKLDDDFKVIDHYMTRYNGNGVDTTQKNWIYFSDGDCIKCIHDTRSHQILTLDDRLQVVDVNNSSVTAWTKGHMRGGTTPYKIGDNRWLAFFHSSVEHIQRIRRYSMTPYIFDRNHIISIGDTIFASTENPIVDAVVTWWHPIVVFPMGIIKEGDDYLVSAGVNDIHTYILRIPEAWAMKQTPISAYQYFRPRFFFWSNATSTTRFAYHKLLKVGGSGRVIAGCIDSPEHYAWITENITGIEWITEKDYNQL